jgi:excinuclease ABC subunit C
MTLVHAAALDLVPDSPGVYLMRDAAGAVIYVGKARSLRQRLAAYFLRASPPDPKTALLISRIAGFETILTATPEAALILEATLIRRHRPRYNVILKDDKRYPCLRLDPREPFPALEIVRRPQKDGALYFGPFASAHAVRQTLQLVNRTFQLRKCRPHELRRRSRPCLHCQMHGCLAPCCRDVNREIYAETVRQVVLFLRGRTTDLLQRVRSAMLSAAEAQDFERAARWRDTLQALQKTVERQEVVCRDFGDRDILGLAMEAERLAIVQLSVRGGQLVGSRSFHFEGTLSDPGDSLGAFIRQAYGEEILIPEEILVPILPWDADLIAGQLGQRRGGRVHLRLPRRGEKKALLAMAARNARSALQTLVRSQDREQDVLLRLQRKLRMAVVPRRIACFDNSNLAGSAFVSGMVFFRDGQPDKGRYRHFRLRSIAIPDDYAAMEQALRRRLAGGPQAADLPDLILVDGGRGQLGVAVKVLEALGLENRVALAGIAKPDPQRGESTDRVFLPGRVNPVAFGRENDLLLFLARIRDEAHRWALAYHRRQRSQRAWRSELDGIAGLGPRRKAALLAHFGSVAALREASPETLARLPGMNRAAARAVHTALQRPAAGSAPDPAGSAAGG